MRIGSASTAPWLASILWVSVAAADPTFIPIDLAEDEIMVEPVAISNDGFVCGTYVDINYNVSAFIRASDGTITTFTGPEGYSTTCADMNDTHDVVGQYPVSGREGGYIRSPKGHFSTFAVSGGSGTFVTGINAHRYISGYYVDATMRELGGFVRNPQGDITTFTVAGELPGVGGINKHGAIAGDVAEDSDGYGFIRQLDGTVTTFDVRHRRYVGSRLINDKGAVAGIAQDAETFDNLGFMRKPSGKLKTFSVPGQSDTYVSGLNNIGEIVGNYRSCDNGVESHGFLRSRDGKITTVDYPGQACTILTGINDTGLIIGYYNYGGVYHGFLRIP